MLLRHCPRSMSVRSRLKTESQFSRAFFARFFHIAEKSGPSAPVSKFCDLFVKKRHDDAAVVVVNEEFRALCHVARQVN